MWSTEVGEEDKAREAEPVKDEARAASAPQKIESSTNQVREQTKPPTNGYHRKDFFGYHARYMTFLDKGNYKILTIGGKIVDLLILYHSVLVHDGV